MSRGIEALLRAQNPDGGFPFIADWEPFETAVAGLGLATAGAERDVVVSMGEFLAEHQNPDGGWGYAPWCGHRPVPAHRSRDIRH